jgi:hypothetical protein
MKYLTGIESIEAITTFFESRSESFVLKTKYANTSGQWGISFSGASKSFTIAVDRGYIDECHIVIDGVSFSLFEMDREVAISFIQTEDAIASLLILLGKAF